MSRIARVPSKKYGTSVRSLRKRAGLSQAALAKRCKCAQSVICNVENAVCAAGPRVAKALARVLGVPAGLAPAR